MSVKMEFHLKWNLIQNGTFTQNGMSLKMKCHSKWTANQNKTSPKMKCHLTWNVTQNGMSLKIECHKMSQNITKCCVIQNVMSLKME